MFHTNLISKPNETSPTNSQKLHAQNTPQSTVFALLIPLLILIFSLNACLIEPPSLLNNDPGSDQDASINDTDSFDTNPNLNPDTNPGTTADTNTNTSPDTSTSPDTATATDTNTDPGEDLDGTKYPIPGSSGFIHGAFERKEAAFDGISQQTTNESARISLLVGARKDFLIGTEWDCAMRVRRIDIIAPINTPFISNTNSQTLQGKPGTVFLMGKPQGASNTWKEIASKQVTADSSTITFLPDELAHLTPQIALGVAFDQDVSGRAHIAEIQSYGYCTTTPTPIQWQPSEWWCSAQCQQPQANAGEHTRRVTCQRDNQHPTDEVICTAKQPKPTTVGGPCQLNCPHSLKFIGYRTFTYSNGSGWLHEGNPGSASIRVGPVPSAVQHGTTLEAIQGKPCSVLTPASEPERYFLGISCTQKDGNGAPITPISYCAFRCE